MEEGAGEEDRNTEQGMETELPREAQMSLFTSRCWTLSAGGKRGRGVVAGGMWIVKSGDALVCLLTIVNLDPKCTFKPCVRFAS